MESQSTDSGVLRRSPPSSLRYNPYASGGFGKEDIKEEVVRLGIELSLYVAESMFLLCDDIRSMLSFCLKLWRDLERDLKPGSPVVDRLLHVMHSVYLQDIEPKNGLFQSGGKSVHLELIMTTYMDFVDGIILLHRLVLVLRKNKRPFDGRLLSSAIARYNQVLKKLVDKLKSAEDVSKANGFARETIESNIFNLWKSLYDAEAGKATPQLMNRWIFRDLFKPVLDKSRRMTSSVLSDIPIYAHYFSRRRGFAKQELREEAVQLGVKLSLYVAESMFLLCDDIRSMLLFCFALWRDAIRYRDSPVVERLLRVIHYVYLKDIKPKNGVYQDGGNSVQWRLVPTTMENIGNGIRDLDDLVLMLRGEGSCLEGRRFTSRIGEALNKVEEKLRCAKAVSEANGFARIALEPKILNMWKSIFDKEAKEATQTLKVIKNGILRDLFPPQWNEA